MGGQNLITAKSHIRNKEMSSLTPYSLPAVEMKHTVERQMASPTLLLQFVNPIIRVHDVGTITLAFYQTSHFWTMLIRKLTLLDGVLRVVCHEVQQTFCKSHAAS